MALTFATFCGLASRMVKTEAICLNIQLVSISCIFETKMFCVMCLTKFLVTVAAAVGAAAGPTEHTRTNID